MKGSVMPGSTGILIGKCLERATEGVSIRKGSVYKERDGMKASLWSEGWSQEEQKGIEGRLQNPNHECLPKMVGWALTLVQHRPCLHPVPTYLIC